MASPLWPRLRHSWLKVVSLSRERSQSRISRHLHFNSCAKGLKVVSTHLLFNSTRSHFYFSTVKIWNPLILKRSRLQSHISFSIINGIWPYRLCIKSRSQPCLIRSPLVLKRLRLWCHFYVLKFEFFFLFHFERNLLFLSLFIFYSNNLEISILKII